MLRERLKELREAGGLSQQKLAALLGVGQSTVGMWESGKNKPESGTLIKLSEIFGVSVDYLIGNDRPRTQIPVLGRVAAGVPIDAVETVLDYEEIPEEMGAQGEYFALQIKGDSMEPRMSEGDVVIVRRQQDVESGNIAIVLVNGNDAACKKLMKHANGVSLISFNPAYPPMFYTNQEVRDKPVTILGRVVELRAKL